MRDSFIDPLAFQFHESPPHGPKEYYSGGDGRETSENTHPYAQHVRSGAFHGAHHFVIEHATMVEYAMNGTSVLSMLHPYTSPDAALDSSARDPPPRCHPGTRIRINQRLIVWLIDPDRLWDMVWLHGPAGTGKSAIAQTFAETCFEMGRLGSAFFFSRPNGRDKPKTVIPSIAYQLCLYLPAYKSVIAEVLADDPQLLQKSIAVQFKKLIIEPLAHLQDKGHASVQQPLLILLDGLDECAGVPAQCQFIKLISDHVQLKPGFPVLWLLCSRPEPHLKHTFSRIPGCGLAELLLDWECQNDVERYLCDEFAKIRDENPFTTTCDWPPKAQLNAVLRMSSGHFQVATVVMNYVNDPAILNPVKQLNILVACLEGAKEIGTDNPFATLDMIYAHILSDIPDAIFCMTRQILALSWFHSTDRFMPPPPALVASNLLGFDQNEFYSALSKLHSVLRVPTPRDASRMPLEFYHASFQDFLLNPNRSGRLALRQDWAFEVVAKSYLDWFQAISTIPDTTYDGTGNIADITMSPRLPGLTWNWTHDQDYISRKLLQDVRYRVWDVFLWGREHKSNTVLKILWDFDFGHISRTHTFPYLVNWVHKHYPSDAILRTKPSDDIDFQLVKYTQPSMVFLWEPVFRSASLPLRCPSISIFDKGWRRRPEHLREFFFIGRGQKTAIFLIFPSWITPISISDVDSPPSNEQVPDH